MVLTNVQLGKSGVSDNFIETIRRGFKRHDTVKISILQSFSRDKSEIKNAAKEICDKVGDNKFEYKSRIIGFTITLFRFRRKNKK